VIEPYNVTTSFEPTDTNASPVVANPSKLGGYQAPTDMDSLFVSGRNHHLVPKKETSRISSQFAYDLKAQWLKPDHNQGLRPHRLSH